MWICRREVKDILEERKVMKNNIIRFLKDESGQTSTEYILLLAVVAAIIFKFKTIITEKLTGLVEGVFNSQGMQDLTK